MKNLVYILLLSSLIFGCSKDELEPENRILMLHLDNTTLALEGVKEIVVDTTITLSDSIPIIIDLTYEDGSGNINLFYGSEDYLLFSGTIESGENNGERTFPTNFSSIDNLDTLATALDKPLDSNFQLIEAVSISSNAIISYQEIWDAISNLKLVEDYMESGKNIGVFVYTSNISDDEERIEDYYVIINK